MPPVGCESKISAGERPQTHALDRPWDRLKVSWDKPNFKVTSTTLFTSLFIYTIIGDYGFLILTEIVMINKKTRK